MPKDKAGELSLDDIRRMVSAAIEKRWPGKEGEYSYTREVFPQYCIVERAGKLWKVPFTIKDEVAELGEPEEVLEKFVPANEALRICEAAGAVIAAPTGSKWRVRAFEYGLSKNRYTSGQGGAALPLLWTKRAAESAVQHLEGASAFADHARDKGGQSVRDLLGFYSEPQLGAKGPEATLTILESEDWAQRKMLAAWKIGRPLGFSVDAVIAVKAAKHNGQSVLEVEEIAAIMSVDLVSAASSGGASLAVLEEGRRDAGATQDPPASRGASDKNGAPPNGAGTKKEQMMKEKLKKVLESLRALPKVGATWLAEATAIEAEAAKQNDDDPGLPGLLVRASEALSKAAADGAGDEDVDGADTRVTELQAKLDEAEKKQRVAESRSTLTLKLQESKLPSNLQRLVKEGCERKFKLGEPVSDEEITGQIASVREAFKPFAEKNGAKISGTPASVGLESRDKAQIGLHKLLGVTHDWQEVHEGQMIRWVRGAELDKSVPSFRGIQEAYIHYTGDRDITGRIDMEKLRRVAEEFDSGSFPNALGSSLTRAMLQGYAAPDYGLDQLVPQGSRRAVRDFRQQERIRVGYFGDLATVDPETADYAELAKPTDEKATYTVVQFGNLVTITRKTIINDDLGFVNETAGKLGRAARRTLAQRIYNLLINNAAIYDGVNWFHATSHGANLTTVALSAAELDVIRGKMRNQTEKDSGKRLGIGPALLVVPHELEGTAKAENMREFTSAGLDPSKVRFMFGPNGERIIISPLLTDATDYYVFADQNEVPCIEVGFLQGRQEPELLLADEPTNEKVFTSDRIRYKVRFEFEAVVTDFRGAHKAAVAG